MSSTPLERLRQRFSRHPREAWIAGVCAGLARSLNTDPALLRVGFIVTALFLPKLAWVVLEER